MFTKVIGKNQEPGDPGEPAPTPTPQPLRPPAPAPAQQQPQQEVYTQPATSSVSPGTRNILSSDVEIKGNVRFTNDLLVDGRIDGEIHSDGSLTVGENARLRAEIHTASIFIHGKVHGNVTVTDRAELRAGSEVVGDIKAKTLIVEAGAVFVGSSEVGTPSTAVEKSKNSQPQPGGQKSDKPQQSNQPQGQQAQPQQGGGQPNKPGQQGGGAPNKPGQPAPQGNKPNPSDQQLKQGKLAGTDT